MDEQTQAPEYSRPSCSIPADVEYIARCIDATLQARRRALLMELGELERQLQIGPTTAELRQWWRER